MDLSGIKKVILQHKLVSALLLILLLVLAACGQASNFSALSGGASIGGTVSGSQGDAGQVGGGSSSIGGAAVGGISTLSSIKPQLLQGLSSQTVITEGVARLYEIEDDGSIAYTGLESTISTGNYHFDGVQSGKNYIVEFIKIGTDANGQQKMLVQNTVAVVPDGAEDVDADITPLTGFIMEYIREKVIGSNENDSFDTETIEDLMDELSDAIADLIASGQIRVGSSVIPYDEDKADSFIGADDTEVAATELLADHSDIVDITEEVKLKQLVRDTSLSEEEARDLIRAAVGLASSASPSNQGRGDDDEGSIPDFFVRQFATAYLNNTRVTVDEFALALHTAVHDAFPTLKAGYFSQANIKSRFIAAINTGKINDLYALYDQEALGQEVDKSDVPPAVRVIFPADNRWTLPVNGSLSMDVPQTLIVMGLSGFFEDDDIPLDGVPQQEVDLLDNWDGPVFDPMAMIDQLGFADIQDNRLYMMEKQVNATTTWVETSQGHWEEVPAIEAHIGLYATAGSSIEVDRVEFVYRDQNGQTQVAQFQSRNQDMGGQSVGGQSTMTSMQASQLRSASAIQLHNASLTTADQSAPVNEYWMLNPWGTDGSNGTLVTNFASGTATIRVIGTNSQTLLSETVRIAHFDLSAIPWKSPQGPNMAQILEQGWDPNFTPQELPYDNDTNQTARPVLAWTPPSITLPDGYKLAYAIDLGLTARPIDWQNPMGNVPGNWEHEGDNWKWQHIWSSWERGRFIRTSEYQISVDLGATTQDVQENYETLYEVNIRPLVVDTNSNRVVFSGPQSRTEFRVGVTAPWTIDLRGTVTLPDYLVQHTPQDGLGNAVDGTWMMGLFKTNGPDSQGNWVDYFFNSDTTARTPIALPNQTAMIATLGTSSQLQASTQTQDGYEVAFDLPDFTRTDDILENHVGYQLIVWYDQTAANDIPEWQVYGNPVDNAIDYYNFMMLEYAYFLPIDIRRDGGRIRYHEWKNDGSKSADLTLDPSAQVLDITVY